MAMITENTLPKSDLQKISTSHPMPTHETKLKKFKQDRIKNADITSNTKVSSSKLSCIILLNIVLTVIYTITCISVGVSKITIADAKSLGILIICLLWIPGIILILHEHYYESILVRSASKFGKILSVIIGVIINPFLPALLFLSYLYKPVDLEYFHRLKIMQSFNLFLHTSMHLILLIVLQLQDQLSKDTACLADDLGRSACLTAPVIVNIILCVIILISSSMKLQTGIRPKMSTLINCLPYTLTIMMFRITSYALIINYIDIWAVIPITCIIFLHILFQGFDNNYLKDKHKSISNDDDNVDGHHDYTHDYSLIWNGSEWSCKPLNGIKEEEHYNDENYLHNISSLLLGIQSSVLYIQRNQEQMSWILLCCCFGNGVLVLVILVIYVLVNYIEDFNYVPNNLDNELFNYLIFLLVLYGIFSPLLIYIKRFSSNCRTVLAVLVVLLIIIVLPFLGLSIFKNSFDKSKINFYTIDPSNSASIVKIHPVVLSNYQKLQEKYETSEIYFDLSCQDKDLLQRSLFFINDSNKACNDIFQGHKGTNVFVKELNLFRSSSPNRNILPLEDFKELRMTVRRLEIMYVSEKEPDIHQIKNYLKCTDKNVMDILLGNSETAIFDLISSNCTAKKFMTSTGKIVENQCVSLNEKLYSAQVHCHSFSSDTVFMLSNHTLQRSLLTDANSEPNFSCCINSTHSFMHLGMCHKSSFSSFNGQRFLYRNGTCNNFFQQELASFRLVGNCLQTIIHLADCNNVEIPIRNTCRTVHCYDIF